MKADSFFLPFLFLASIGIAIIYNMGTNLIFGEISYLTQAMAAILQLGVTLDYSIFLWHSFEEQMTLNGGYDAIIILGCVIRGETPHFDYICQGVTAGIAHLNATSEIPVVYGLLTTDNLQQAKDRSGGTMGNKGDECAVVAIKMAKF